MKKLIVLCLCVYVLWIYIYTYTHIQNRWCTLLTTLWFMSCQSLNSSCLPANSLLFSRFFFSHDIIWYGISLWSVGSVLSQLLVLPQPNSMAGLQDSVRNWETETSFHEGKIISIPAETRVLSCRMRHYYVRIPLREFWKEYFEKKFWKSWDLGSIINFCLSSSSALSILFVQRARMYRGTVLYFTCRCTSHKGEAFVLKDFGQCSWKITWHISALSSYNVVDCKCIFCCCCSKFLRFSGIINKIRCCWMHSRQFKIIQNYPLS